MLQCLDDIFFHLPVGGFRLEVPPHSVRRYLQHLHLIALDFGHNFKYPVHRQQAVTAQLPQPDRLRKRGRAVLAFNGFQQLLLFFGQ